MNLNNRVTDPSLTPFVFQMCVQWQFFGRITYCFYNLYRFSVSLNTGLNITAESGFKSEQKRGKHLQLIYFTFLPSSCGDHL